MLCLSAQSNPQGVPKELLEAKKLELIQEKVISVKTLGCHISSYCLPRLTLKKPLRKPNAEKSRRGSETGTLIPSGSGSAVNEEGAVEGATGEAVISIEAHRGILDLHLHDVEVRPEPIIAVLRPGVKLILICPAIVVAADRMVGVVGHPPSEDQSHDLPLVL